MAATRVRYFCSNCGVHFEEKGPPNINRMHYCGTLAKIMELNEEEEKEDPDE